MKFPVAFCARVGGGFEPAFGREDVVAAVAVDVSDADAVAEAVVGYYVLDPSRGWVTGLAVRVEFVPG